MALRPLDIGTAAEYLVCADLVLRGYQVVPAPQNSPFDLVAFVGPHVVRIQVKGTLCPRTIPQRVGRYLAYRWSVGWAGRDGRRPYKLGDFDILALVALDAKEVAYLQPEFAKSTIHIRAYDFDFETAAGRFRGGKTGRTFRQHSFEKGFAPWLEAANG